MGREHAPKPGITWDTRLVPVEQVVSDTAGPNHNAPAEPRPNRAARRALDRQNRKANRT